MMQRTADELRSMSMRGNNVIYCYALDDKIETQLRLWGATYVYKQHFEWRIQMFGQEWCVVHMCMKGTVKGAKPRRAIIDNRISDEDVHNIIMPNLLVAHDVDVF